MVKTLLAFTLFMGSILLTGCGGARGVVGTYVIADMVFDGESYFEEETEWIGENEDLSSILAIELKEDETFVFAVYGEELKGTYEVSDNTLTLDLEGELMEAEIDGNQITVSFGTTDWIFEKE